MSQLQEIINEKLKDPQFREAWESGGIEDQVQRILIQARIDSGLSQKQLAEKTNIAQSNISAMERGSRLPNVKTLQKIAAGLGKKIKIDMV